MGMRGVCLTAGPLIMIIGGLPLLFMAGFASMINPQVQGWERTYLFWSRLFDFSSSNGWVALVFSVIFLFGLGLFLLGVIRILLDAILEVKRWLREPSHEGNSE